MFKQILLLLALMLGCSACKTKAPARDSADTATSLATTWQSYLVSFSPTIGSEAIEKYVAQKGYRIKYRYARNAMLSIEVPISKEKKRVMADFKQVKGVQRVSIARNRTPH